MSSNTRRYRELLLVLLALCAKRPVGRGDLAAGLMRRVGRDYRPSPERVEYAIGALVAEGLIESEARAGEVSYRTTASGVEALDERAETRIDTFPRRLCDVAQGGQVVVSETVRRRAGSPSVHAFEPLGALALKGSTIRWTPSRCAPQRPDQRCEAHYQTGSSGERTPNDPPPRASA